MQLLKYGRIDMQKSLLLLFIYSIQMTRLQLYILNS